MPASTPVITPPGIRDHDAVERPITMLWNGRSRCRGIGDRDRLEQADSRGGGAPRRVERNRLWALRTRRAAVRLGRHVHADPAA